MAPTEQASETPSPGPAPFYVNLLWIFSVLWTITLFSMNVAEMVTGGRYTYQGPGSLIYLTLLGAYAGIKEAGKWATGDTQAEAKGRRGTLFVGAWLVLSMVAFIGSNVDPRTVFPRELLTITLEVLGVFFGTHASRAMRGRLAGKVVREELPERILAVLKQKGPLSSGELVNSLGSSRGAVQYALKGMLKDGKLMKDATHANNPETRYKVV